MEEITKERLLKAGWTETRRVNITNIENKYCEAKVNLPDNVKNFLSEYGYLVFDDKDRREDVEFIPEKAIGYELDKEYFEELLEEYDINEVVYPVGMISQGNLMIVIFLLLYILQLNNQAYLQHNFLLFLNSHP